MSKDQIEGTAKKAVGVAQEAIGKVANDEQLEARGVKARVEGQGVLERFARPCGVACLARRQTLTVGHLRRLRNDPVQECAQLAFGQHADELVDGFAIYKGHYKWNAAYTELC